MIKDKKCLDYIFSNIIDNEQKIKQIISKSKVNNASKVSFLISFILFVLTISVSYFKNFTILTISNSDLKNILTILLILSIYVSIFALIIPELKIIIKPTEKYISNFKRYSEVDLKLAKCLSKVPLENLEFINDGLKFEISTMKRKSSMLIGTIDKTGAIPLLLGLLFTINKLLVIVEFKSEIIDYAIYIILSLYFSGLYVSIFILKLERYTSLLDSAIKFKKYE